VLLGTGADAPQPPRYRLDFVQACDLFPQTRRARTFMQCAMQMLLRKPSIMWQSWSEHWRRRNSAIQHSPSLLSLSWATGPAAIGRNLARVVTFNLLTTPGTWPCLCMCQPPFEHAAYLCHHRIESSQARLQSRGGHGGADADGGHGVSGSVSSLNGNARSPPGHRGVATVHD